MDTSAPTDSKARFDILRFTRRVISVMILNIDTRLVALVAFALFALRFCFLIFTLTLPQIPFSNGGASEKNTQP